MVFTDVPVPPSSQSLSRMLQLPVDVCYILRVQIVDAVMDDIIRSEILVKDISDADWPFRHSYDVHHVAEAVLAMGVVHMDTLMLLDQWTRFHAWLTAFDGRQSRKTRRALAIIKARIRLQLSFRSPARVDACVLSRK
jgi:energy-converting hydrogenase Eha subunit A